MSQTHVDIAGDDFLINGRVTHAGRVVDGMRIEGLLFNSRMVQGVFDDLNLETRSRWDYPDGPWDAERNTREFVAAMEIWRRYGLDAFTLNLQGGSPEGYSRQQPWHNSAFEVDGSMRPDYTARTEQILDRADELGMVVILGLFYFGQDQRLADEAAVCRAVDGVIDWLLERGDRHVIIEIANEVTVPDYDHTILQGDNSIALIERVRQRSSGRLFAGTSLHGAKLPSAAMAAASDLVLLHGNGVREPERIRSMVRHCRDELGFSGPIVFNEDDHFDFDQPENNMLAAVSEHASWGFFDYRQKDEGYEQGYQSVPVDWGVSSDRKRGFFSLVQKLTGAAG